MNARSPASLTATIAQKSGPPAHIHRGADEFFYVVSGELKFKLGDRIVSAPARSIVFVPRGDCAYLQECRDGARRVAGRRDTRGFGEDVRETAGCGYGD
jgi:glyoxylate utilization-related uncharacterized protein